MLGLRKLCSSMGSMNIQPAVLRVMMQNRAVRSEVEKATYPKRPMTAYNLFIMDQDFPKGAQSGSTMKVLAQKWKELSDSEKKPYVEKSETLQEEYRLRLAKLSDDVIQEMKEEKNLIRTQKKKRAESLKLKKVKTDLGCPKRPPTPYIKFCMDRGDMDLSHDDTVQDRARKRGMEWRALDSAAKKKYQNDYKRDREIYLEEVRQWRERLSHMHPDESIPEQAHYLYKMLPENIAPQQKQSRGRPRKSL